MPPREATWGAAFFLAVLAPALASGSIARFPDDQYEMSLMRAQNPGAAASLETGEALAESGHLEEALASFKAAATALPDSALPRRRECEALTALGHADDGAGACFLALQYRHTNIAVRAVVRSLVDVPEGPTLAQVGEALSFLTLERGRVQHRLMLSSALCDIAERIGDGTMLQRCTEELVEIAPDAEETRRALHRLDSRCPPWRFWLGWVGLAVAVLGTALHAILRWLHAARRARLRASGAVAVAALAALVATPNYAIAGTEPPPKERLGTWPLNDEDPESTIPKGEDRTKDPLEFGYWLQDVALKGELAMKRHDYQAAGKYYRTLAKAVPDRAVSFVKLCNCYEALGDMKMATPACGSALLLEGVRQEDYAHYVRLVISKPGPVSSQDQVTLQGVVEHLKDDPAAHPLADELECLVGQRTSNRAELRECTKALAAQRPHDISTIEAQFALAALDHDFSEAARLLDAAKQAGADEQILQGMERALVTAQHGRVWAYVFAGAAAALFAAGAGLVAHYVLRHRKRASSAAPAPSLAQIPHAPEAEKA